ncbi:intermembrane phospholipid transport protein YdbH family protein, partial [Erwinia amylovora]|uniref:intermembrane phospholipid transport protein YdbH family protein n=1 Tax=Erwinia amylovora TaxID=552 RepID=UPI0020C105DA
GQISLITNNWQHVLAATELTGRLNLLTQVRCVKANVPLGLGPGKLDQADRQLPLRLTGAATQAQLQFDAGLPGVLRAPLLDPQLQL